MKYPILIGLNGRFRSGKDTFYYALRDQLGPQFVRRLSFGDFIRCELAAALGVPFIMLDRDKEKFRGGLQWWAQYKRGLDKQYWVKPMRSAVQQLRRSSAPVKAIVITDVRMKTDADFVRSQGGVTVRIVRPLPWRERLAMWCHSPLRALRKHVTETELQRYPFDYDLRNDGTVYEFRGKAFELWTKLQVREP